MSQYFEGTVDPVAEDAAAVAAGLVVGHPLGRNWSRAESQQRGALRLSRSQASSRRRTSGNVFR
jgi:hypothetical protein